MLRNNSSVHSVAVTQFCDTLVLTASTSSSNATSSSHSFSSYPERVSWPFFRLSICLFLDRSLGFLEKIFQHSLERLVPPSRWSSLQPPGHHENHLTWCHSPHFASLVLSAFGHLSRGFSLPLTVLRSIFSEWTPSEQSPFGFCSFIPHGSLFSTVHNYYILCIYCKFVSWFFSMILIFST